MFLSKFKIQILKESRQKEFLELDPKELRRVGDVWWMDYPFAQKLNRYQIMLDQVSRSPELTIQQKKRLKNFKLKLELSPDLTVDFVLRHPDYHWNGKLLAAHPCWTFELIQKHSQTMRFDPRGFWDNPNLSFQQYEKLTPVSLWHFLWTQSQFQTQTL